MSLKRNTISFLKNAKANGKFSYLQFLGNSFLKGMHLYLVRMKLVHPVKSGELAVS